MRKRCCLSGANYFLSAPTSKIIIYYESSDNKYALSNFRGFDQLDLQAVLFFESPDLIVREFFLFSFF